MCEHRNFSEYCLRESGLSGYARLALAQELHAGGDDFLKLG